MSPQPLKLTNEYTWLPGDTLHVVAYRYCRGDQWKELLEHNSRFLSEVRNRVQTGDIIKIPDSWFPIPTISYGTSFIGNSTSGKRDVTLSV